MWMPALKKAVTCMNLASFVARCIINSAEDSGERIDGLVVSMAECHPGKLDIIHAYTTELPWFKEGTISNLFTGGHYFSLGPTHETDT